jgi:2'-5' RNA ligase
MDYPLPTRMADRWQDRPEPGPGEAQLYWHILMRDQPQARALAAVARQRLARFDGLHATPEPWLHLSVLRLGLSTEISAADLSAMVDVTRQLLQQVPPVTITVGQVLYHPEAIALGIRPPEALDGVSLAVRKAAAEALALSPDVLSARWIPHLTVAYSTQDQDAAPIIAELGRELPDCPLTIDTVHLVAQYGAERDWNWQPLAVARLG